VRHRRRGLAALKGDLASVKSTPSFAYIAPDRCDDGNPTPCTPGAPAGLAPANAFLEQVVPEITGSKAYKESGLLVITVDEAPSSGAFADSSSCCGQPLFPNDPVKSIAGAPRGGGTVGALLLSPFVKGGTVSQEEFNHFSLLRTIEDLFAFRHLGYAGASAVKSFEPSMFIARAKG
jgi:phosphatidylinositol-3-phosphatase